MMSEQTETKRSWVTARSSKATPDAGDLMAVVEHYQSSLLRYVGQTLGHIDHETEDIVQEVFVRLHKQVARHGSESVKHLTTWLFRVAHNQTVDLLRRRSRRKPTVSEDAISPVEQVSDEMDALGEVLRREARQVALQELARLEEQHRQVVLLKIIQGMSLREVAEVVGVSVSLVNYRLNQGLAELAQRLKRAGVV